MLADQPQGAASIDDPRAVEMQLFNGSPPRRRATNHDGEIFAPRKVVIPSISPRVKEWSAFTAGRIRGFRARKLAVVAPLARQREVGQKIASAPNARNDVLH